MEKGLYQQIYKVEDVHWWFVARRAIVLGLLARYLPASAERVILDAGCGTGGLLSDLDKHGRLVATDASVEAVKFCKRRGFEIVQCSALEMPFAAETFDVVLGLDLLEHVNDDRGALNEFYRICRRGGLLLTTVPAFRLLWSHYDELSYHHRRYTRAQLHQRLESANFRVVKSTYFNSYLFPLMFLGRVCGGAVGREPEGELDIPHRIVNRLFSRVFAAELALLRRVDLPIGGSILSIARKA